MTEELKACAHCGMDAVLSYSEGAGDGGIGEAGVVCTGCGVECSAQEYGSARKTVVEVWNARAIPSDVHALVISAKAVVVQWDTPNLKRTEHTATFINKMREALKPFAEIAND